MTNTNTLATDLVSAFGVNNTPSEITSPYDSRQRRRKLLTYYQTFNKNLHQHVLNTADLSEADAERIVAVFFEHIDSYSGLETKVTFRDGFKAWALEWVSRYAVITATVIPLLPTLTGLAQSIPGLLGDDYRLVTNRLLDNLNGYQGHVGDTDALAEWAADWVTREVRNCIELAKWIEVHQGIVIHGLREILSDCRDLVYDGTIDELASEVWHWVSLHVNELLEPGAPLHLRIRERAVYTALGWRTQRLREGIKYRTNYEILESEPDRDENLLQPPSKPNVYPVQY